MRNSTVPFSFVCLAFLYLVPASTAHGYGAHALEGTDPPNTPNLPDITGAFEIHVRARFDTISGNDGNGGQTILEYSGGTYNDMIWFGQIYNSQDVRFSIYVGGTHHYADCSNHIVVGEVIEWELSVDSSGLLSVEKKGGTICTDLGAVPNNVPRNNQLLGEALNYPAQTRVYLFVSTTSWFGKDLAGAVLGIRIRNIADASHWKDLDFWNLPGQLYGGFTASFYARFDDSQATNAKVFCFSDGDNNNAVSFGRESGLEQATFSIQNGEFTYHNTALTGIQQGEMEFWHVGLFANGTTFVDKNGVRLSTSQVPSQEKRFRSNLHFGEPCDATDDVLDGVVLGFGVDPHRIS